MVCQPKPQQPVVKKTSKLARSYGPSTTTRVYRAFATHRMEQHLNAMRRKKGVDPVMMKAASYRRFERSYGLLPLDGPRLAQKWRRSESYKAAKKKIEKCFYGGQTIAKF